MTANFTTLGVEEIGHVRRITLARPEQHNPLTPRCIREIRRAGFNDHQAASLAAINREELSLAGRGYDHKRARIGQRTPTWLPRF